VDGSGFRFRITNKQDFTSLNYLTARWELLRDGSLIHTGEISDLDISPRKSKIIELPVSKHLGSDSEYLINFHFSLRNSVAWAPAGHEVAWEQIKLSAPSPLAKPVNIVRQEIEPTQVQQSGQQISLNAGQVKVVFDQHTGELIEFGAGTNLLKQGPRLNVWRAPTDNDGIKLLKDRLIESMKVLSFWESLGVATLKYRLKSFRLIQKPGRQPEIVTRHQASGREQWQDFTHTCSYLLLPSGKLIVSSLITTGAGIIDLPRVGVNLCLQPGLENLSWYGRGPWENYPDRKASAMLGIYHSTVSSQYVPYIMPQEHGHKTDTRWLSLTDQNGHGLQIVGYPTLEYNASHFTENDLYHARHTIDLQPRPEIWLNIDSAMRGLGTASCGPDTLDPYRLLRSRYSFSFSMEMTHEKE
jgi:beta-galactosidase